MPSHTSESPAKKQSKWSPEEDAVIIELRGSGMKWEDISKRLPGRSAISCRLHYQNYLERRSEWDEERKNKLARLYERFKPDMWAKVAEEMQVPWRAAEAMHWQLGEQDMARRAGVVPFSLTSATSENPHHTRLPPQRGHHHSQSHGSIPRDVAGGPGGGGRYGSRGGGHGMPMGMGTPGPPPGRSLAARRETLPPRPTSHYELTEQMGYGMPGPGPSLAQGPGPVSVPGLPPIHTGLRSQGGVPMLPGVAELTTGVSPYSTPAYSMGAPSSSPAHSQNASPGPFPPSMSYPFMEPSGGNSPGGVPPKRRASPDTSRETSRRRQYDPRPPGDGNSGAGSGQMI